MQRDGRRQRGVVERLDVAQLQPGRPVGEGAAVTAHSVGRGAGGNKGYRGVLGVNDQEMRGQGGFDQDELVRKFYKVQRIKVPVKEL
jgi:hypothetical protein